MHNISKLTKNIHNGYSLKHHVQPDTL